MTTQLQTVLDALEMTRVMTTDSDGKYSLEITPEKITKAIAIVRGMMEAEPVACIYNGNQYMRHEFMNDKIPEGSTPLYLHPAPQQAQEPVADVTHMVNRFLCWKIPRYFAPDGGITFHLNNPEGFDLPQCWPIGTNLLTADQAREMFEYCLQGAAPQRPPLTTQEVEAILSQHDYNLHGDRARYIVRMTERAHHIREAP